MYLRMHSRKPFQGQCVHIDALRSVGGSSYSLFVMRHLTARGHVCSPVVPWFHHVTGSGGGKGAQSGKEKLQKKKKKKKESKPCILLLLIPEYTKCDWVLGLWNASHKPQKGAVGGVSSTHVLFQPDEVGAKRV